VVIHEYEIVETSMRQYACTCSKLFARRWLAAAIEKNAINQQKHGESHYMATSLYWWA